MLNLGWYIGGAELLALVLVVFVLGRLDRSQYLSREYAMRKTEADDMYDGQAQRETWYGVFECGHEDGEPVALFAYSGDAHSFAERTYHGLPAPVIRQVSPPVLAIPAIPAIPATTGAPSTSAA